MERTLIIKRNFIATLFVGTLVGCGGGGASPANLLTADAAVSAAAAAAARVPPVLLTVTPNLVVSVTAGEKDVGQIAGTWQGPELAENALVFLSLSAEDQSIIPNQTIEITGGDTFTFPVEDLANREIGEYTTTIELLPCEDADCSSPYEDSGVSVPLTLAVTGAPEWTTFQGNASHTGYVPITIDATDFPLMWEWARESENSTLKGINMPVAGSGVVYVATDVRSDDGAVVALSEADGTVLWSTTFVEPPSLNNPGLSPTRVFIATTGHDDTYLWALSRETGAVEFQVPFGSQFPNFLAPTVFGGRAFQEGGQFGGETYAVNVESGVREFTADPTGSHGMGTPAVDAQYIYSYNTQVLNVTRHDGQLAFAILDPSLPASGDAHAAPVKGSGNNVLAYSGSGFSGRASANAEHFDDRPISNYDIEARQRAWSSDFLYKTHFALADGLVYAGKDSPTSLDAIDELTGDVVWSWNPPSAEDTAFHRNVIATRNLLFVSTDSNIYAITRDTQEVVWTYNEPGMMAISDNSVLLVAPGARESDGRLLAFDLR